MDVNQPKGPGTGAQWIQENLLTLSKWLQSGEEQSDLDTQEMATLVALVSTTVMAGIRFIVGLVKIFNSVSAISLHSFQKSQSPEESPRTKASQ